MKRNSCPQKQNQTLGLILLTLGVLVLALLFLPPVAWVFVIAVALIVLGIVVLKKK